MKTHAIKIYRNVCSKIDYLAKSVEADRMSYDEAMAHFTGYLSALDAIDLITVNDAINYTKVFLRKVKEDR